MRYFTQSWLERLMMQTPKPRRENSLPTAPKGHRCYGCGRYGEACVLPCYRDERANAAPVRSRAGSEL